MNSDHGEIDISRHLCNWPLQEEILNKEVDRAKDRREAAEANATPDERIAMNAAHRERAKELQQKEVQCPVPIPSGP